MIRALIKEAVYEPAIFLRRRFNYGRASVLFYHAFPAEDAAFFRRQCAYLSKHYRVVSMTELASYVRHGRDLPPRSIVITVDDGRRDFYLNAYPILREYALPAMMYLPTAYLDGAWLWFHRYEYIFERTKLDRLECRDLPPLPHASFDLSSQAARAEASFAVVRLAQWLPAEERDGLADALSRVLRVRLPETPQDEFAPLAWDEVREMARHGIEFGGHTVNHPILQTLSAECLEAEIAGSKARIEQELQRPVIHFAYPSGKEEEIPVAAKEIVQRCGYETAVTTLLGRVSAANDPFWLPRVGAALSSDWLWFRRCVSYVGMSR